MQLSLEGKVALVAGSSRGIGRAIAEELLREGASVTITGRNAAQLESARRALAAAAGPNRVWSFAGDLTDPKPIGRLRESLRRGRRLPDIVVANIGSGTARTGWDVSLAEWDRVLRVNLLGAMALVRSFLPGLRRRGWGRIIVIASIAGREAIPAPTTYAAAKAALIAAAQSLSRLTMGAGVTVNVVAPGNILFPGSVWERKLKADRRAVARYLRAEVPAGRLGRPDEVAAAVAFLASDRADFVNGACLVVDGGQSRAFG
jgi:3-oxoacyl-[acyl-carrier protein] reductase